MFNSGLSLDVFCIPQVTLMRTMTRRHRATVMMRFWGGTSRTSPRFNGFPANTVCAAGAVSDPPSANTAKSQPLNLVSINHLIYLKLYRGGVPMTMQEQLPCTPLKLKWYKHLSYQYCENKELLTVIISTIIVFCKRQL